MLQAHGTEEILANMDSFVENISNVRGGESWPLLITGAHCAKPPKRTQTLNHSYSRL